MSPRIKLSSVSSAGSVCRTTWPRRIRRLSRALVAISITVVHAASAQTSTADSPGAPVVARTGAELVEVAPKLLRRATLRQADGRVRVIVELSDPPLALNNGGVANVAGTSRLATGTRKLQTRTPAAQAYLQSLDAAQDRFIVAAVQAAPSATVDHRYKTLFNGLAIAVKPGELVALAAMPGVKKVYADSLNEAHMDSSLPLIEAQQAWGTLGGSGNAGTGIFVAVIDTGIRPENPLFDGAGFTAPMGFPPAGSYCATTDPTFCNGKVIVARWYAPTFPVVPEEHLSPLDFDGHGTHTAGTSAGNSGVLADSGDGIAETISGVAPRAHVGTYKALFRTPSGRTSGSDSMLLAAIDDAVLDGADVVNNSWGGSAGGEPEDTPYPSVMTAAEVAGVVFVFSAGNSGSGQNTIGCPGCVENVITVAASTTNRLHANTFDVIGPVPVPPTLAGLIAVPSADGPAFGVEVGPLSIKYSGDIDAGNVEGCAPFPVGSLTGSFALIQRGTCFFATKADNAATAGATGVLVYNSFGDPFAMGGMSGTTIPALMLSASDGVAVRDWVQSQPGPTGTVRVFARIVNNAFQDIVAGFSSRGPNGNPDVLKPDITAPGVRILSGHSPEQGSAFAFLQGTSMAAPHVTGAAALLLQAHPTWTPSQVKTALTSTADQTLTVDGLTPATPFDAGAGRLNVVKAISTTVTFDKPSMADNSCTSCMFSRSMTEIQGIGEIWVSSVVTDTPGLSVIVDPPSIGGLPPGATTGFTVTVDTTALSPGNWYFAHVIWTALIEPKTVRMPIAVFAPTSILYVDENAFGGNNGSSWFDAFNDLQDALTVARDAPGAVAEIWVAQGTYKPDQGSGIVAGDRFASFTLINGVGVYGGFAAFETLRSERDPAANVTILSGDLLGDDALVASPQDLATEVTRLENSLHVVTGTGTNATAIIDGFTITAGYANGSNPHFNGGGMFSRPSGDFTIRNCIFTGNGATSGGGGMYNNTASPTITDCAFTGNWSQNGAGMVNIQSANPVVTDCTFTNNFASKGCCASNGGGMFNSINANPTVVGCLFEGNFGAGTGGAMFNINSDPNVLNCSFIGNTLGGQTGTGGAIHNKNGSDPTFVNCLFSGNSAPFSSGRGGAIFIDGASSTTLINCTLAGNSARTEGGGIFVDAIPARVDLTNCVLWDNSDAGGTDESAQVHTLGGLTTANFSLVQGGWSGAGGFSMQSGDPGFADPLGADGIAGTIDDDLRLTNSSPAIDSGDTTALPPDTADLDNDIDTSERLPIDLDGRDRVIQTPGSPDTGVVEVLGVCVGGVIPGAACEIDTDCPGGFCDCPTGVCSAVVDMGAFEFQPPLFVDAAATGANDGSSWFKAYVNLQDALDAVGGVPGGVSEIWVADGTYRPDQNFSMDFIGDRTFSFQLINGVSIYGGFAGGSDFFCAGGTSPGMPCCCVGDLACGATGTCRPGESSLGARDPATNVSILTGDLQLDDVPAEFPNGPSFADNSFRVVVGSGTDATAVLDGFTITAGNANGGLGDDRGAGMQNGGGSPTVRNCVFSRLFALDRGAGMNNLQSSPTVDGCTFVDCIAQGFGAAMMNESVSAPVITDCVFENNISTGPFARGGGMHNSTGSNPTVRRCQFTGNAAADGAGIYSSGATTLIEDCTFTANTAANGGGAVRAVNGTFLTVRGSTFSNNVASGGGGAISSSSSSFPTIDGCTFQGNSAVDAGGALLIFGSPDGVTITRCTFDGNTTSNPTGVGGGGVRVSNGGGGRFIDFVNCRFTNNVSASQGGGISGGDAGSELRLVNCLFSRNAAINGSGGGIVSGMNTTLLDSTVAGNTASVAGAGLFVLANPPATATLTVTNSILWNNVDDGPGTVEGDQLVATVLLTDLNYSLVQGLTGAFGGIGNIDADPLFVDASGGDMRTFAGSPARDAGNTLLLPADEFDLDGDGDTSEFLSLDLAGSLRVVDDPDVIDTGVAVGGLTVDMGAFEGFADCNHNGQPDECDIDCGALPGVCDAATCGTSLDVDLDGSPDECLVALAGGDWSGDIWGLGGANPFPDNGVGVAGRHVVLDGSAVPSAARSVAAILFSKTRLDIPVEIASLTIINDAILEVTEEFVAADLRIVEGPLFLGGTGNQEGVLRVAFDRVIDVITPVGQQNPEPLIVAGDGVYQKDALVAATTTASISADKVIVRACVIGEGCFGGGRVELIDEMLLHSRGDLVLIGSPTPAGLATSTSGGPGTVSAVQGLTPPPKFTVGGFATLIVEENLYITGASSFSNTAGGFASIAANVSTSRATSAVTSPGVTLRGHLINESRFPSLIKWETGGFELTGTTKVQTIEVAGIDLGLTLDGFDTDADTVFETARHTNYSMRALTVGTVPVTGSAASLVTTEVVFQNKFTNTVGTTACAEAVYVDELTLHANAKITLAGVRIYYKQLTDEGATIVTVGCGELVELLTCVLSLPPQPDLIADGPLLLVPSVKNRFLSFSDPTPGTIEAVRVTFVELPGAFAVLNGTSLWVDTPFAAAEAGGKSLSDPIIPPEDMFLAARLRATPLFLDWSLFGTVHVFDERIVPSRRLPGQPLEPARYHIQFIDESCNVSIPGDFSPPLEVINAQWCDMGQLFAGQFHAPDGEVAVADTLAVLAKFSNAGNAPIKARAELLGVGGGSPAGPIDGTISVSDLLAVLSAFSGTPYPFPPPAN